jgi:hypothetical protein
MNLSLPPPLPPPSLSPSPSLPTLAGVWPAQCSRASFAVAILAGPPVLSSALLARGPGGATSEAMTQKWLWVCAFWASSLGSSESAVPGGPRAEEAQLMQMRSVEFPGCNLSGSWPCLRVVTLLICTSQGGGGGGGGTGNGLEAAHLNRGTRTRPWFVIRSFRCTPNLESQGRPSPAHHFRDDEKEGQQMFVVNARLCAWTPNGIPSTLTRMSLGVRACTSPPHLERVLIHIIETKPCQTVTGRRKTGGFSLIL